MRRSFVLVLLTSDLVEPFDQEALASRIFTITRAPNTGSQQLYRLLVVGTVPIGEVRVRVRNERGVQVFNVIAVECPVMDHIRLRHRRCRRREE
jgi:hypothetical protein